MASDVAKLKIYYMPIRDIERRRAYNRSWMLKRRKAFFEGKVCANCSSSEELELDHINRDEKIGHKIWSWRKSRFDEEISKCQILCRECHNHKTSIENMSLRGELTSNAKFTKEQIKEIKALRFEHRWLVDRIAVKFCVHRMTISKIINGRTY